MTMQRMAATFFAIVVCGSAPLLAKAQSAAGTGTLSSSPSAQSAPTNRVQPGTAYLKPTHAQKFRNYLFDSFGPYAVAGSVISGSFQQAHNAAPEWGDGWDAYGVRVANSLGINLVATTARYGLAELFREDTIFYRCDCSGFRPRLSHALISTLTARRGSDGHRTFSFSNLAAPYAGTMTAVLGWYPSRYEPMDGFRIGNYKLLTTAGVNVAKEFIYGGPHTLMARTPFKHITGSDKGSTP